MAMLKEFKDFASQGSVIDLAVGVVIGAAFGKIVSSLVQDVLMPPIGLALGNLDFSSFVWVLKEQTASAPAVTLRYGLFCTHIVEFSIVAVALFLILRPLNALRRSGDEASEGTRSCRFCKSAIHPKASRCPHCTAVLKKH